MDTKGSIKDVSVRVVPSEKFLKFLSNLEFQSSMPESIIKFIKVDENMLENLESKPRSVSKPNPKTFLNSKDMDVLNKIIKKSEVSDKESNDTSIKNQASAVEEEDTKPLLEEKCDSEEVASVDKQCLYMEDLVWLFTHLQKTRLNEECVYLHELLEGSDILLPENETIKRNPILEARCEKLRREQMNRDYRAMTKGVDNVRARLPEDTIAYQIKHLNRQLIAVGQFIISLFAGFLFGFTGVELMVGGLDFGFRLLLGVMCALIIALAEIYFLAKKLNEEQIILEDSQLGGPAVFPNLPKPHND